MKFGYSLVAAYYRVVVFYDNFLSSIEGWRDNFSGAYGDLKGAVIEDFPETPQPFERPQFSLANQDSGESMRVAGETHP